MIGGLFQGAYEERELALVNLSRSLEDSVTITEPLMPWTLFCYGGPFFSLLIAALYRRTGFGIRRLESANSSQAPSSM